MNELNLLIVDDEKAYRENIEEFFSNSKMKTFSAELPSLAFDILKKNKIDIVVLDLRLPEMNGLDVLKEIKKLYPEIEVIIITGHGDMDSVIKAMRLGAIDFFTKPFRLIEVQNAIERTKKFIYLQKKLNEIKMNYSLVSKELKEKFGNNIIGKSKEIKNVLNLMVKVAKAGNTSVLITGESGTGKELVARGIHSLSDRKDHYFYAVNCSAVPENLFESSFFGHKKGAFTGANEDKKGWFEIASGGTLFLDEIGDMPAAQQSKFLRVLEEKKITKVGSHIEIPVDVRIIAATNKDAKKLITNNVLRADLYHRLSSFEINIPPLRERIEDIPLLLDHFIELFSVNLKKNIEGINKNALEKLMAYDFPGNIRELKNMIEKAVILCDGDKLAAGYFGFADEEYSPEIKDSYNLQSIEKNIIGKALQKTRFNKTKAAELLNITRQALDRRIEKYRL
ncbi:MAG: sigma-54 dependent transcriptional regulator [Candidatus Cloacimonetes bacterium]|nr:sigma-54 dependent transcriptional regulator [Candidatus Cloacimonadota bacterium]